MITQPIKKWLSCLIVIALLYVCQSCSEADCEEEERLYNFRFHNRKTETKRFLKGVHFINQDKGFIVGDGGTILKTVNGGRSFIKVSSGTQIDLYRVAFVDDKNGFITGNHNTLLRSKDGGETWDFMFALQADSHFRALYFIDAKNIFAGGSAGKYRKSSDYGLTWKEISIPALLNKTIYSTCWPDATEGLLGCSFGTLALIKNGRTKAFVNSNDSTDAYWDIDYLEQNQSYYLARSTYPRSAQILRFDSQHEATEVLYEHPDDSLLMWGVDFLTPNQGIAIGGNVLNSRGILLTTTNAGKRWKMDSLLTPTLADMYQIDGKIILVGDSGTVLINEP